jgi:hypothetical protein
MYCLLLTVHASVSPRIRFRLVADTSRNRAGISSETQAARHGFVYGGETIQTLRTVTGN